MFLAITLRKYTKEMERGQLGGKGAAHLHFMFLLILSLLLENRFYVKQCLEFTLLINIFLDTTL